MKKFLSIILVGLMVVTMLPMAVMPASAATPTPYDGVPVTPQKISSSNYAKLGLTSSNWSQFNGYYAIRNAKELYGFAAVSRSSYTANAVLLQDIVVNANGGTTYDWTPIISSNAGKIYDSIFDGNGHYISGLYSTVALTAIDSNNAKFGGFILRLGGTVKNLVIKDSTFAPWEDISTYGGLGAITGYPVGCTIQNCRVENVTLKSINDGGQLGGIAGYGNGNNSTIKNCVSINVTFSGGIVTDPIAPKAPYSSCYTSATASHNCTNLSVEHKEVKATCEYPGLSNYKYCLVCGKVTSGTKTETPATGHTLKSATCIAPKTCTICGATEGSIDNTAHSWANNDGICANGCGTTCAHKNQTGSACGICGAELHVCSNYNNGFCTECDAYEPAQLKDGYYQIKNGGNLFWYANYINTVDRTANAVLVADIDLENRPWTPIGSTGENSNNFRGIFDGQNYTIKGLYVEGDRAGLGFFGEVRTGTVKNFTIFGEVVVNTEVDYVGGVIGSICGVNSTDHGLERNGAIIQNIKSFVNLTAKAHGVGKIGGFVGYANHQSLIENCSWYGTFDAGEYRVDNGAGGFIGRIQENSSEVTIRNCAAYGTIKTNYAGDYNNTATIYMGGFLSFSNTSAKTTLENCLFAGKFERGANLTDEAFLGAFGTLRSVKAIKNCYYLGDDGLEAVHSDSNLKPGSDNVEITKVTEKQLKSGEVAYKLQEANEIWGQSIGTDSFPVLGGEEVYYGYIFCDDEVMVYTNDSRASDNEPDHSWDEGVLTRPTKTQEGYYTYTCTACGEATKTEEVERATNYDDYTKALEDLRAYLDSDMLTDENKSYISQWLATYDTDEAFSFIAGEEAIVQEYIDATAYYASEIEAAIEDCLAGNHSGNGETCEICGTTIKFATITGVSINVDGVVYTSDNTSAENPAVIDPDSVVTFTVTGENFDLLPAGPENAVIGFTYFSHNLEWLYNNSSKFDIDTVNNTVSFPANYDVLYQATTASELTYTNDGWNTDIGSGVYVIYIDKKDIADTLITLDNTEFIYSGNTIEPTVLVMADGQVLMAGEHYTLTFESNVNAGTASVTVKGIGDYAGEVTKNFTITKAYYNLTAPTPNTLTYNGEELYLVAAGTVEGADFEYSLDGASWSTSIPQAKDVGNYTVYYRVLADENHYGIEGTVDVTIKECPHEWNEGVLTRPVYDAVLGSKDGYYTYTCSLCGEEKTETVKIADYSAYEAVSEEINALLQSDELIPEAKQAIYSAANECGHLSNDLTESEQNIVDDLVAELEKIVDTAEEKIASGEYVKADYTEIDEAIASVDEALENATISEEMANELSDIKSQLEALKANKNTSMADAAELLERVKAVAKTMADCANGIHSFTKYEEVTAPECGKAGKEVASCDHGCGATDEKEIPALTHEPLAAVVENEVAPECEKAGSYDLVVYCDICGEELDRDTVTVDALTHSFTKYEVTEEAECGKAGKEVAYCDNGCGATDEKEIPALTHEPLEAVKENEVAPKCGVAGSYDLVVYCDICGEELDRDTVTVDALTHKDEDGDYLCDHGCGHEFQKPSEPDTPDTPDTPDEPTDDNCDHLCHKTGFMGFIWKIIKFFFKLFDIQQYCDCGALHY